MAREVEELEVTVEGRRWHYYASGEPASPPLLMVHGFRSSARFFRPAMRSLSDGWRVVAPDLPGHGDSEPWDPDEDVVEQWVLLEGFLEAVGMERMAVIGNSRGGAGRLSSGGGVGAGVGAATVGETGSLCGAAGGFSPGAAVRPSSSGTSSSSSGSRHGEPSTSGNSSGPVCGSGVSRPTVGLLGSVTTGTERAPLSAMELRAGSSP